MGPERPTLTPARPAARLLKYVTANISQARGLRPVRKSLHPGECFFQFEVEISRK